MTSGAVTETSAGTVIWAAERDLARSLRRYTGILINFFCSVEHLREWEARAPRPGQMLSLDEMAVAGKRLWRRMLRGTGE